MIIMKKIVCALLALICCLSFASCGDNGLTESMTSIKDSTLTPTLKGNYYINYLDSESTEYVAARVGDELFFWNNLDTVMHYYHKASNGWDEYTKNAQDSDEYGTEPVNHYNTADEIVKKSLSALLSTDGIENKDKSPKPEEYNGLACLKYTNGDNYTYISTDYNIIVESCRNDGKKNQVVFGLYRDMKTDDYTKFDDSMIPKQFK